MSNLHQEANHRQASLNTRRLFLRQCALGMGGLALGGLTGCGPDAPAGMPASVAEAFRFAPRARRVIYLHMAGAPSQLELFDHKPALAKLHDKDCPPYGSVTTLKPLRSGDAIWRLSARESISNQAAQ